jgi:hypothetical protein
MALVSGISSALTHVFQTWKELRRNRVIAIVNRLLLLLTLASLAAFVWYWRSLPPQVPLWYSRPWGLERLAHPAWLLLLPTSTLVWYALAVVMSAYITREYLIFTQVLLLTTLLGSFLSFITLMKIFLLVT